jgi:hypothetical protein
MPSCSSLAMALLISCCCMHNALACSCLPLSVNEMIQRKHIGIVFLGTVVRTFTARSNNDPAVKTNTSSTAGVAMLHDEPYQFIVQVTKVYKGCHIKTNERIVVSSNSLGAMCGMSLTVNANYIFSTSVS